MFVNNEAENRNELTEPKYSVKEAAQLMQVSISTIWREIGERGRLGHYRIGNRTLVGETQLLDYMKLRKVEPRVIRRKSLDD